MPTVEQEQKFVEELVNTLTAASKRSKVTGVLRAEITMKLIPSEYEKKPNGLMNHLKQLKDTNFIIKG